MGGAFSFARGAAARGVPGACGPLSFAPGVPSPRSRWERLRGLPRNPIAAYFSYGILLRVLTVCALLAVIRQVSCAVLQVCQFPKSCQAFFKHYFAFYH